MSQPFDKEVDSPIHQTQVELGDGESEQAFSVSCPVNHHSMSLNDCDDCKQKVARVEGGRNGMLRCRVSDEAPSTPSGLNAYMQLLGSLLERTRVGEVMTREVICVDELFPVGQLATLFTERQISGVPVVDEDHQLIGIVSQTDVLRDQSERGSSLEWPSAPVRGLMTPAPVVLREQASIGLAAALMANSRVHRVPVVSERGKVVGMVTSLDVVRHVARRAGYVVAGG